MLAFDTTFVLRWIAYYSKRGSVSGVVKINVQTKSKGNSDPARRVPPRKRNKRAWSKTCIHFVLVKVHERHYKGDVRRGVQASILLYVRVRSTDFNKALNDDRGVDWRSIYTTYHSTTRQIGCAHGSFLWNWIKIHVEVMMSKKDETVIFYPRFM